MYVIFSDTYYRLYIYTLYIHAHTDTYVGNSGINTDKCPHNHELSIENGHCVPSFNKILTKTLPSFLKKGCIRYKSISWNVMITSEIRHLQRSLMNIKVSLWSMEQQRALKNVNNCLNTNIYSYLETSVGQSSYLHLNFVQFFNTSVN